jgi:hypothetical protein
MPFLYGERAECLKLEREKKRVQRLVKKELLVFNIGSAWSLNDCINTLYMYLHVHINQMGMGDLKETSFLLSEVYKLI